MEISAQGLGFRGFGDQRFRRFGGLKVGKCWLKKTLDSRLLGSLPGGFLFPSLTDLPTL